MGVKIGGDADNIGKSTHLLVVIRMRISHHIGLFNLANELYSKKETAKRYVRKVCASTEECV